MKRDGGRDGGGEVCLKLDVQGQGVEEFKTYMDKGGVASWKSNNFSGRSFLQWFAKKFYCPNTSFWFTFVK